MAIAIHDTNFRSDVHVILNSHALIHNDKNVMPQINVVSNRQRWICENTSACHAEMTEDTHVIPDINLCMCRDIGQAPHVQIASYLRASTSKRRFKEKIIEGPT